MASAVAAAHVRTLAVAAVSGGIGFGFGNGGNGGIGGSVFGGAISDSVNVGNITITGTSATPSAFTANAASSGAGGAGGTGGLFANVSGSGGNGGVAYGGGGAPLFAPRRPRPGDQCRPLRFAPVPYKNGPCRGGGESGGAGRGAG